MAMLTIVADANIASLEDYFCEAMLGVPVRLICVAGRDISASLLAQYQPDALLVRSVTCVDASLLADNDSVRFVGSATIGTDHVDQAYLASRDIVFANAAGCSKHSVAQYVLTAILSLRPIYWSASVKLGIIGLGNIGSTLADYAADLGWQVLGYDPYLPASAINNATFADIIRHSNVISLHVPLTTSPQSSYPTYHLINQAVLQTMPADTLLINSARGQVINEADLLADLERTGRQVVLDVFEHEPVVLAQLLNQLAIATPHIAGYTLEGKLRGTQMVFEAFVQWFTDGLTVGNTDLLSRFLPPNPFHWQELLAQPERLAQFYDILADDHALRQAVNGQAQRVEGVAFDALRKDYALRREWKNSVVSEAA